MRRGGEGRVWGERGAGRGGEESRGLTVCCISLFCHVCQQSRLSEFSPSPVARRHQVNSPLGRR